MKPGEYELPPIVDWPKGAPLQDIEDYGEKTVAAVEKAHAERNCGNCEHLEYEVEDPSEDTGLWLCEKTSIWTGAMTSDPNKGFDWISRFKCNEWKSKEADNADA